MAGLQCGELRSVHHRKLRTWKNAGTVRLFLRFRDGGEKTLIYKRAVYSLDEIPANEGLPVHQGPPEIVIARVTEGPLTEFLPRTYWSREHGDDQVFEYVWEDLNTDFENLGEHRQPSARNSICECLAAMHSALRQQFPEKEVSEFLDFDRAYSERIWEYAMEVIPAYYRATSEPLAREFLVRRDEIRSVFLDPSFHADRPRQVVHGDCNATNLWIRRPPGPLQLKAVDWEWAGYGMPHADIISIVKWSTEKEKDEFLRRYCAAAGLEDVTRERFWLRRANMERAILDAAFLAKQCQDPSRSQPWFENFVRGSLEHLLHETSVFLSGAVQGAAID